MTKKELIILNINLANAIAAKKKRALSHIHYEDLQSAAYMGLVEAANNYDSNKNDCFQSFAVWRISGAIKDYLREINWGSRRNPINMSDLEICI